MAESITCFACDQEPVQQCPRCGRPYCEDHGEELCDACLEPASGVPSFTLYRGSLLALLTATALAVWLLVQPGGGETEGALRPVVLTPTSTVAASGSTPAGGATTPAGGATNPAGSTTPAAQRTPTSAAGGGSGSYTVVGGDTLGGICNKVKPASMSVDDCVEQIVALNNLGSENALINVGDTLIIPQ